MNSHPDLQRTQASSAAAPLSAGHLSADQIDDQLIGDLAAAPAAHLAACSLCTARVAASAAPIASFQHVATAWSERRSATLPIPVPAQRQPLWQRHMAWATACLTLAVSIALANASHQFTIRIAEPQTAQLDSTQLDSTPLGSTQQSTAQLSTQQVSAQQSAAQPVSAQQSIASSPRAAQISADNHMLQAIDDALAPAANTPAALGLQPASDQPDRPPTSIQD